MTLFRRSCVPFLTVFGTLFPTVILAQALVAPGDLRLRSDLELLADSGAIEMPLTSWPIPADEINRALAAGRKLDELNPAAAAAWERVARAVGDPAREAPRSVGLSGSHQPTPFRTFDDSPRRPGEIEIVGGYSGGQAIAQFNLGFVTSPPDHHPLWLDGSYVDYAAGNWILGVSAVDRWWGPGWDGSLILSNSARPFPAIVLERRTSDPFHSFLLHWLGRWRFSMLLGELEEERVGVRQPTYIAARGVAKPLPWLEIAASRSIIYCGQGRPCDLTTWEDAIFERQNPGGGEGPNNKFERAQLAGFDLRANSPWHRLPAALYAQLIGEDASGGIPFKYMAIFGAEAWHATAQGGVFRAHIEFVDTACSFYRSKPIYGCAYNDALYAPGDRYKGAPIGDSFDSDAQVYTAGVQFTPDNGATFSGSLRTGRLDRGGVSVPYNTITPLPQILRGIDAGWRRSFSANTFKVSLGYEHRETRSTGLKENAIRSYLQWTRTF